MRKLSSILTMFLVLCLTVGGVSAAWVYSTGAVEALKDLLASVTMGTWKFTYTISFVNDGELLYSVTVDQGKGYTIKDADTVAAQNKLQQQTGFANYEIDHWMNAGSTAITGTEDGHTTDITVYPSFKGRFTATFVAQDGTILKWTTIPYTTKNNGSITIGDYSEVTNIASELAGWKQYNSETINSSGLSESEISIWGKLHNLEDLTFDYWQVQTKDNNGTITKKNIKDFNFSTLDRDITLYPVYTYKGDANLIPVDTDGDGEPNHYEVGGYSKPEGQDVVEIPSQVNGVEVTTINGNAFASYEGIHVVVIPKTIASTGNNIIAATQGLFGGGQEVSIYFQGTYSEWQTQEAQWGATWDTGLSETSRVYFLDNNGKVDLSQGYLTPNVNWITKAVTWSSQTAITQALIQEKYEKSCTTCSSTHETVNGIVERRPDYIYWGKEDGTAYFHIDFKTNGQYIESANPNP